jgi:hypothetical protein
MSEPSGPAVPDVIAERVFEKADGQEVRALIGRPREGERDWECDFQIIGVGTKWSTRRPALTAFRRCTSRWP